MPFRIATMRGEFPGLFKAGFAGSPPAGETPAASATVLLQQHHVCSLFFHSYDSGVFSKSIPQSGAPLRSLGRAPGSRAPTSNAAGSGVGCLFFTTAFASRNGPLLRNDFDHRGRLQGRFLPFSELRKQNRRHSLELRGFGCRRPYLFLAQTALVLGGEQPLSLHF